MFGIAGLGLLLWLGGVTASLMTGHGLPHAAAAASGLRTLAHPGNPTVGWRTSMPGPVPYWIASAVVVVTFSALAAVVITWWRHDECGKAPGCGCS